MHMTWRERLLTESNLPPNSKEYENLVLDAAAWTTCVIGEQRRIHGDVISVKIDKVQGIPTDQILSELGFQFYSCVKRLQIRIALQILDQIEDRVLQLKREVHANAITSSHPDQPVT